MFSLHQQLLYTRYEEREAEEVSKKLEALSEKKEDKEKETKEEEKEESGVSPAESVENESGNDMANGTAGEFMFSSVVKAVLTDHCHERPPVLKDHIFLVEGPTFQCNWACHQRPPVLRDQIFMANGVVFQDRFLLYNNLKKKKTVIILCNW